MKKMTKTQAIAILQKELDIDNILAEKLLKLTKKSNKITEDNLSRLIEAIKILHEKLKVNVQDCEKIISKAIIGGETDFDHLLNWINERLLPNSVLIDENGYTKMCVDALKIVTFTAATDYGSSRQRDLGQLWADITRGYLGEYAFQLFLEKKKGIKSKLGHEKGQLEEYLPMDIHEIKFPGEDWRKPNLKIGIKTTKWNGIWLDIPGDQFNHSDIHMLVKVGVGRDHLFAFLKNISVFKDKVLKKGIDIGLLTKDEAQKIYDNLPIFKPIPAYICGFVRKDISYNKLSYSGKKGAKDYTITTWNGPIMPEDLDKIKEKEKIEGKIKFEGIGTFSHNKGYLFNTGSLKWKEKDWQFVWEKL